MNNDKGLFSPMMPSMMACLTVNSIDPSDFPEYGNNLDCFFSSSASVIAFLYWVRVAFFGFGSMSSYIWCVWVFGTSYPRRIFEINFGHSLVYQHHKRCPLLRRIKLTFVDRIKQTDLVSYTLERFFSGVGHIRG